MGTMRDDIEASLSALDEQTEVIDDEQVEAPSGEGDEHLAVTAEADEGEPTAPEADDTGEGKEKEGAEAGEQLSSAEAADDAPSTPKSSNDSLKAPVGWSPKEREQWSKIPRPLQERIHAREREMAQHMAGTKEARQTYEAVSKVAQSFGPVLAADGFNNPVEAMQAAFGTMAALRMGTQEQKAKEVARLVSQYGVDIGALDDALVGTTPTGQSQQGAVPPQLERILSEKLAPMQQFMQTVEQLQQQQANQGKQQAQQAVQQFAEKAEFLADVREDMADIIDIAAKRGVNLTLEQAYNRACAANPEISQILEQRRQQDAIRGNQQQLGAKRAAASSLSSPPTGTSAPSSNMTLREQIAAAFENAGG